MNDDGSVPWCWRCQCWHGGKAKHHPVWLTVILYARMFRAWLRYAGKETYIFEAGRKGLMEYGVHKPNCATQKNTGHKCTCGLYIAIAQAHGHTGK